MATKKEIQRHKTAIKRYELSAPMKSLLRDQLLAVADTVFDFGCGRGSDVKLLRKQGFQCRGWDPAFAPNEAKLESDVVNIGYVINVIEDPDERAQTLLSAWGLCRNCLLYTSPSPRD